jgi:AbrB family looped-hinge helix DNA binding protein
MDSTFASRSTLRDRGQLTLPAEVREALHVEPGDEIEFVVDERGHVEVRGLKVVPADQAWFWTERWQRMEAEASADVAAGRLTRYDDGDAFLASLSE